MNFANGRSAGMLAHVHEDSHQRQGAQQGTAPIADHGERNAFGGHHAQHHTDIDQTLHHHHHGRAEGQVAAEIVAHAHGGAQAAPENHTEAHQQGDATDQAQLFAHHSVNEIGMRSEEHTS